MVTLLVLTVMVLIGACIIALFTAAIPAILDIAVTIGLIALIIHFFKKRKKGD